MEYYVQLQKLCQFEAKKFLFLVCMVVAITHLLLQSFMLPYGTALRSLLPNTGFSVGGGYGGEQSLLSSERSQKLGVAEDFDSVDDESSKLLDRFNNYATLNIDDADGENGIVDDRNRIIQTSSAEVGESFETVNVVDKEASPVMEDTGGSDETQKLSEKSSVRSGRRFKSDARSAAVENSEDKGSMDTVEDSIEEGKTLVQEASMKESFSEKQAEDILGKSEKPPQRSDLSVKKDIIAAKLDRQLKKKIRAEMPPKTVTPIDKMNRILVRQLKTSRSQKLQWPPSSADKEILDAKAKILTASSSEIDEQLYAPLFRNISMFSRSYELMMKRLKVYVYKEGEKPIFHQPPIKGLYASEGWFMKLMEGNKRFVVKDPRKAHLFYMPFSSRMLEYSLYVRGSHNRTNLRDYMKNYAEMIAAKYPFWNRTGGTDHFLVACHDWAPYETRHHMENCIKALCNADVTVGFKIGRDISLPETYVRYARNPLRNVGGKPPSKRDILAFYAGNNHGYLRPILLKHWKNTDPDMRIYGLMPSSVAKRMSYIQHMKSSKFCICPKGYEVNSPRIVEAILYECVPVIISDNFIPSFFEVLNWEAFSVILPEKDIVNLKSILKSISREKYLELQLGVRRVQRHFLWHARPVKYDLFYMTLHSIWYNRVFQTRPKAKTLSSSVGIH